MATTDYKFAGTAATVDRDSKVAWGTPDSAKADDTSYATCAVAKNTYGDWLRLTNFGFTSGDIPVGAAINGIEMQTVHKASATGNIADSAIYLRNGAGAQVGNNKASATEWNNADETWNYGASNDMWGTSLTQADIVDTDFGIDISCRNDNTSSARTASIDFIKIRITYTPATTTTTTSSTTTSSSSTSTSTSTSSSSSSSSTSSSSTTTALLDSTSGGLAFGEQSPTNGETPVSYKTFTNGAGVRPDMVGDLDWGKVKLDLDDQGRSRVYAFADANSRQFTLELNKYGTGVGVPTLQIRGDSTTYFAQDAVDPSWENYSSPVTRTWQFVQVRVIFN
jgi:hypothetical protein